jgi:serine phosphatase RsbU (regulator of sigma subunit)
MDDQPDARNGTDSIPEQGAPLEESPGIDQLAETHLSLLSSAAHLLLSAPNLRQGLTGVSRLLIPNVADWVVIDLSDPDTGQLERAILAHRDPELEALGLSALGPLPAPTVDSDNALTRAIAGEPTQRTVGFQPPESTSDPLNHAQLDLLQLLGSAEAITAALHSRSRTMGALTLVRSRTDEPYRNEHLVLASELASRIALVVENAWLFERLQRRAEEMQLALLPTLPSNINGIALAGVYRPADDVSQVGGDWYDTFNLRDGTIACVIGDVAGHDLRAATRMGAIRHKLRAIAADRMVAPSEVLARLDTVLQTFAPDDMATIIYSRLIPSDSGWTFEWSSAGHPPPLLLGNRGRPARLLLRGLPDAPLGVERGIRNDHRIHLSPGTQLVLYTDGLIETEGRPLTHGLSRLIAAASQTEPAHIRERCETLVKRMEVDGCDDVAVLGLEISTQALQ